MSPPIYRCAVIGNPIAHSRSPDIHHQFARSTGLAVQYSTILATEDNFTATVQQFFADGGTGLNITLPFKEHAYRLCTTLSPEAKAAKAVNTLMIKDGQLYGHNTDGIGLVRALQLRTALVDKTLLIIGAGGATRGVVLPLLAAGVSHITLANRTVDKAHTLINDFVAIDATYHHKLTAIRLSDMGIAVDIAINATSATYAVEGEGLHLPSQLQFGLGFEMAYGKPSSFIDYAKQLDVPVFDGVDMLIQQAVAAFELWFGVLPDSSNIML